MNFFKPWRLYLLMQILFILAVSNNAFPNISNAQLSHGPETGKAAHNLSTPSSPSEPSPLAHLGPALPSSTTTAPPSPANITTVSPSPSNTITTSLLISTTTVAPPLLSNTTTAPPSLSNITTASPSLSNTTTTSSLISTTTVMPPPLSNATTTPPSLSNITTASPSLSNTTTTSLLISITTVVPPPLSNATTAPPSLSNITTASPSLSNTTTTSLLISTTTVASPPLSNATTTPPSLSNITTASPSLSNITTTPPSLSNITTASPSLSNTTTTPPSLSNITTASPSLSNITTTPPSLSNITTASPSLSNTTTVPPSLSNITTASSSLSNTTATSISSTKAVNTADFTTPTTTVPPNSKSKDDDLLTKVTLTSVRVVFFFILAYLAMFYWLPEKSLWDKILAAVGTLLLIQFGCVGCDMDKYEPFTNRLWNYSLLSSSIWILILFFDYRISLHRGPRVYVGTDSATTKTFYSYLLVNGIIMFLVIFPFYHHDDNKKPEKAMDTKHEKFQQNISPMAPFLASAIFFATSCCIVLETIDKLYRDPQLYSSYQRLKMPARLIIAMAFAWMIASLSLLAPWRLTDWVEYSLHLLLAVLFFIFVYNEIKERLSTCCSGHSKYSVRHKFSQLQSDDDTKPIMSISLEDKPKRTENSTFYGAHTTYVRKHEVTLLE